MARLGPGWNPAKHDPILKDLLGRGMSVYAIADHMEFNHQTVERHIRRLAAPPVVEKRSLPDRLDPKAEADNRCQVKKAAQEFRATAVIPWEYARGTEETPLHYAGRVLKVSGNLPVVSLLPAEKIRRANLELKSRGLPQIADRKEWVV